MVTVEYDARFVRAVKAIRDSALKRRVKAQIRRIVTDPAIGKRMRYARKGTREVRVGSYRLAYAWIEDTVILLELYHKNEQ